MTLSKSIGILNMAQQKKKVSLWEQKTLCGKHFWKIRISLRKAQHQK